MNPSLLLIPDRYKAAKLYSQIPDSGAGDLTFARNSSATRVNSAGLIEKVRTNLNLFSQDFTNAAYVTGGFGNLASVVANTTANPLNGVQDADTATFTAGLTQGRLLQLFTGLSITSASTYSIYLKAGTLTTASVFVDTVAGINGEFNLTTGVVIAATGCTASIQNAGNGFYRCSVTWTTSIGNAQCGLITSTDGSLILFGAQLESSDFGATPYIPTTTAAVSVGITANIPRLDYTGGGCPSLLLEPQRTNLITFSEQFNNAGWIKSGVSITANNTTSPDGTANADLVTTSNATSHELAQSKILTGTYTCSFYVKKNNSQTFYIALFPNGFASYFNLNNGTVSSVVGAGVSANIINAGNGWFKCSITFTNVGSEIQLGFLDTVYTGGAGNPWTISTSIGTSGWVWGAQVEAGSYQTSYIPTLGSSVTRLADVASKTGISSLIGQTEGTLFVDMNFTNRNEVQVFIEVGNGTTERILIYCSGNSIIAFANASVFSYTQTANERIKIAFAYKSGNSALYVNGVQKQVSSAALTYGALPNFLLGSNVAGVQTNTNPIYTSALYPTRLTNAELATLTAL